MGYVGRSKAKVQRWHMDIHEFEIDMTCRYRTRNTMIDSRRRRPDQDHAIFQRRLNKLW